MPANAFWKLHIESNNYKWTMNFSICSIYGNLVRAVSSGGMAAPTLVEWLIHACFQ